MSERRFIKIFLLAFFAILTLVGIGNYVIDPYGMHFHTRIEGINKLKPGFIGHSRVIKLLNADIIRPEAIFLGNSRLLYLSPEEAFSHYKPYRYYNFALSSGRVSEMDELLAYSIRNYDIKYVCYGIDLVSMIELKEKYESTFDLELTRGEKSKFLEMVKLHTSTQAIQESYHCVTTNMSDRGGTLVITDYNKFGSRTGEERKIAYALWGDEWMDKEFKKILETYTPIYNDPGLRIADFNKEAYKSILDQCLKNDIEYDAFTNPLYKDQFNLLIASEAYPVYIEFLTFLAQNGGFWYFGGVNDISSNKSYYWDSQHPRKELSELIAGAMLSENPSCFTSPLFGTFYNSGNISLLIAELDKLRKEEVGAE